MYALKNDSGVIKFDRSNYVLTSADYGSVTATHSTAKGVEQIGERVVNTTLDTRDVEIIGFIKAGSASDMEAKKAALYQMCDPRRPFQVMPDAATALTCYATDTVKFTASRLTNNERVARFVIDAVAHDPLFSDAAARYRKIAQWASNFLWPLQIPSTGFTFADRSDSLIAILENGGDVETGLLIHFTAGATVQNPKLTNVATGEFIKLNRTLVAGETVVVNTNYGQEGVTSYIGDVVKDVINDLDLSSTFLQAPVGTSQLHYTAESNVTSMTVTIYFNQRYLGV